MKVQIAKLFDFDAAHFLPMVAEGHKCKRMHGHTYRVEVRAEGEPDGRGMVVDYAELAAAWAPIHAVLDHRVLNEVPGLENPTTEILAPWILERFARAIPEVRSVRVYESATTWCEAVRAPVRFPLEAPPDEAAP
jgi:6-pyruvoyltetrahydropterin/6-carboxytetrahydropterin synthase